MSSLRTLTSAIVFATGLMASAGTQAADTVTLKIAHFLPGVAQVQRQVLEPWCDDLGRESGGRIRCQFYPALQLGGTAAQLVDLARNGVADIVWTAPGYSAGRFPKTEVLELPGMLPVGGLAGGRAIWTFYQAHLQDEYAAYKMLALHGDGGMTVHTANKQVAKAADFAGLKLRAPNRTIARTLTELGATPVAMPPAQMTEAISKGVVDGASAVWEVIGPTKLDEVTRFHLETSPDEPVLGATVLALLMNRKSFDAMPADLKAILEKNSGMVLVERFGRAWDATITATRDRVKAQGQAVTVLSGSAYDEVLKKLEPVTAEWIAQASAKGIDAAPLAAAARQLAPRPH